MTSTRSLPTTPDVARAMPRYPVYVPTKGRYQQTRALTVRCLIKDRVPFYLVVEPSQVDNYAPWVKDDPSRLLVLPENDRGLFQTRNWIKEHATAAGHARHWQIDDNIQSFWRWYKGRRLYCRAGVALRVCEDFSDRYENVAISGLNYVMFGVNVQKPFVRNVHIYSCSLVNNAIPHRWRLAYNDDTDICLQVLADGWCTVLLNAFLVQKITTMKIRGGNTDDGGVITYQGDGRLRMARALERIWPYVVYTDRRWERPQHVVRDSWKKFDTPLIRKPEVDLSALPPVDEYGMELTEVRPVKSAALRRALGLPEAVPEPEPTPAAATPERPYHRTLDEDLFPEFVEDAVAVGLDRSWISNAAVASLRYHAKSVSERAGEVVDQERRWYESLDRGEPDYGIYAEDEYVADLWACWRQYSRHYLRQMRGPKSLPEQGGVIASLGAVDTVADLGCGLGLCTAALAELFPGARVIGTNLPDIRQTRIAERVGERYGFTVRPDFQGLGHTDLVFASEYFEHFPEPVAHLHSVIDELSPTTLIFANAFGTKSPGHFHSYTVAGAAVPGGEVNRLFAAALRDRGYQKVKTGLWNNRPAV